MVSGQGHSQQPQSVCLSLPCCSLQAPQQKWCLILAAASAWICVRCRVRVNLGKAMRYWAGFFLAVSAASEELCSVSAPGKPQPGSPAHAAAQLCTLGCSTGHLALCPHLHPSSQQHYMLLLCSLTSREGAQIHGGCGMSCRAALLGLGVQVNPAFPLPIPTLTAAWWRLISPPGWFGDLQDSPQAVSCAVFPHSSHFSSEREALQSITLQKSFLEVLLKQWGLKLMNSLNWKTPSSLIWLSSLVEETTWSVQLYSKISAL